jgi:ATP-binding cassette subfamily A (ABC1) protein 3
MAQVRIFLSIYPSLLSDDQFLTSFHYLLFSVSGKTTTISMLTGMIAPTEGHATIAGKDIRSDMGSIRQELGICLQHDCLFPELTVREHIQLFSRIKGMYTKMSYKEAEEKVDASIEDVALSEKRNSLSKNLSGGMKRKLSVAIAFCGDSKTVLLDEPTSGMVSTTVASVCCQYNTV